MASSLLHILVALLGVTVPPLTAKKILFYTGGIDPAHHRFMQIFADKMVEKGHTIEFLTNSVFNNAKQVVKVAKKSELKNHEFQSPFSLEDIREMYTRMGKWGTLGEGVPSGEDSNMVCTGHSRDLCTTSKRDLTYNNVNLVNCEALLSDTGFLQSLKSEGFEFYVGDPSDLCSVILAQYLGVPYAFGMPITIFNGVHDVWAWLPSPSSYVPNMRTDFDDDMTFPQRLINTVVSIYRSNFEEQNFRYGHEQLKKKFNIRPDQDLKEAMLWTEIWIYNVHFTLDFPRPLMPNLIPVGGLVTKKAEQLPKKWKGIMEKISRSGFILVSFGSLLDLSQAPEIAEAVAGAVARLPQTIIWKYTGPKPSSLGNNTILVDDIPQNDLLGHPKIRAFITHGESISIHEALYHEVPMIIIPFFLDQSINARVALSRGIARRVLVSEITEQKVFAAAVTAMTDPKIKNEIKELSFAFRDNLRHPLESAGLWLDHVIKFKGDHLRPIVHELWTYQYYLIDVGLFLLAIFLTPFILLYLILRCFCRCVVSSTKFIFRGSSQKRKKD